jgi:chromosomal replication initiator protein
MDEVHVIPFSGRTLEFDYEGTAQVRFPSTEYGFLIGQENGILEPLIQEIVDGRIPPERQPIFLYGVPGTGRTHLLKGILETWRKNQTNDSTRRQSYYTTCADFHRHFTEAVGTRTTSAFRRRYCQAKLLLLDDLEQLLDKPAVQTELRLLLDDFAAEGGIVVLTAQTLPDEMTVKLKGNKSASLSADLAVRIQKGTTIPVSIPGTAVRQRFLRDAALALGIPVEETALEAAAKRLTGTIPQLYAAVAQKYMEAKVANVPLTTTFWQQFSPKRQSHKTQDLTDIAKRTVTHFSLKVSDLKGESRCKTVALARCLAVYLAKSQLRLTYKEIGQFFGKRDASTVRYLFEKAERDLKKDSAMRDHLVRIGRMKD